MNYRILFITTLAAALLLLCGSPLLAQEDKEEGKIGSLEKEVSKDKDADEGENDDSSDDGDSDGNFFANLALELTGRAALGVFIIFPNEDSLLYGGSYRNCYFSDYPYADPEEGLFSQTVGKKFSVNISGHYFYDEENLTGYAVRARFSPLTFASAEVHFTDLTEKLSTREDHLKIYNIFINYNRLRLERWAFWWGLGLKGLQGDETYNGFAFNLGTEVYPARPVSFTLNYSGGFINGTYLPEFFGSLNLHLYRFAIFAGYQYWSAGGAKIDGLVGGVRLFF